MALDEETIKKYTIPGTNIFNWSKYSRENIPQDPPRFREGDKVIFTVETIITKVGSDCDGTVLYSAEMIGSAWGEEHFIFFT